MDTVMKDQIPSLKESKNPSVFDFGTEELLKKALEEAGFKEVNITRELHSARYKEAEDYWQKLYKTGPELRNKLSDLSEKQLLALKTKVCEEVEKFRDGNKIVLPSEALIATAIK
jgi:phage shock protein A